MPPSSMTRFSIRTLLILVAFIAIGLGWYADRTHLRRQYEDALAAAKAKHHYTLTFDGTPGVRLDMTLVTRPASKRVETVTVPFSVEVEANTVAAWVEYLPEGQSGNDGDTWAVTLKKDGATVTQAEGTIKKDERKTVYVNGDIHALYGRQHSPIVPCQSIRLQREFYRHFTF